VHSSEAVALPSARNRNNETSLDAGPSHVFGGKGNAGVTVKSASYSTANDSVKITLAKPVHTSDSLRLTINARPRKGLQGANGQFLNGSASGKPGANAVIDLGAPPKKALMPSTPPKKTVTMAETIHVTPMGQLAVERRIATQGQVGVNTAAAVPITAAINALLDQDELAGFRGALRAARDTRPAHPGT
jgi:hypothetical protein